MTKILGSVLAGLVAFNAGLPALGLPLQITAPLALATGVAIAAITFYLKGPNEPEPV